MIRSERQVSTLQDDIEAYEEYHWAKNLTATNLECTDWLESRIQDWFIRKRIDSLRRESSITIEPGGGETTSVEPASPFEAIEDRLSDDEKVNEIVLFLKDQSNITFAKQLADRLRFLFDVSREEYPEEVAIHPESLRCFVGFLQSAANLKYPDVVLSPSKNIRAQWRTGPNRHFAVEFLPSGDGHFVIFTLDPRHPEKTIRMSGIVSVEALMETVQPHGVLSWSSL